MKVCLCVLMHECACVNIYVYVHGNILVCTCLYVSLVV